MAYNVYKGIYVVFIVLGMVYQMLVGQLCLVDSVDALTLTIVNKPHQSVNLQTFSKDLKLFCAKLFL